MMNKKSGFKNLLLGLSTVLAISACASSNDELVRCNENPDIDSGCGDRNVRDEPDWKEANTSLPPLPEDKNLHPIDAFGASRGYDYFIDRASIVRGRDEVMRYTVVVRSAAGKANAFHEGLRCKTSEVRTYAYAGSGGTFRKSSSVQWKRVASSGVRGYQVYLENVIMCDKHGWAWDTSKVLAALDAQYTAGGVRIERACNELQSCGDYYNRND